MLNNYNNNNTKRINFLQNSKSSVKMGILDENIINNNLTTVLIIVEILLTIIIIFLIIL